MAHRGQTGFTLIELMVAVVILGIVSALAIPLYRGYVAEARISTAIKDIRQMEVGMDDLALDNDLAALDADSNVIRGVFMQSGQVILDAPGATPAGANPWLDPWGNIYRYQRPGVRDDINGNVSNDSVSPQGYDLFSAGPDGVSGNGDDIMRGCNGESVGTASGNNCS